MRLAQCRHHYTTLGVFPPVSRWDANRQTPSPQAFVVPYRLAGNRYSYLATDHQEHWLPLFTSWAGGHQVFEPVGSRWPDVTQVPDPWAEAVASAVDLAQGYFRERGDWQALKRLPRAQAIAMTRNWRCLGDDLDTCRRAVRTIDGCELRSPLLVVQSA